MYLPFRSWDQNVSLSRIKKQSQQLAQSSQSSRSQEINSQSAMYNASAPPPVNPFFNPEFVALGDIQSHLKEDTA